MERDTVYLKGSTIRPWPERSKFKDAFLKADPEDAADDIAPHAGFIKRESKPKEPDPSIMNPASLIYKAIEKMCLKSRKRKKAKKAKNQS